MKRWQVLTQIIRGEGLNIGAEIGVKSGRNIDEILKACPGFFMYAIDPWCPTENYSHWPEQHHRQHEQRFNQVVSRHKGRVEKMKMFSHEAAERIDDASLDFVFIDGDHSYEGVRQDIDLWLPKIRGGGIISGHDYDNDIFGDAFRGVDRAVEETFGSFEVHPDHVWSARV